MILGGLTPAEVKNLSPEVRAARAAYISDSYAEMDDLRQNGVRELRGDHPDKDNWLGRKRTISQAESLDLLLEHGYQVDAEGNVYEPDNL